MRKISLLDCTLRDGGCVIDFSFGRIYMREILEGIEQSNVEIIECGYIDEREGSTTGRTQFINEQTIVQELVKEKKSGKKYVAMIDYGKFDVNNLLPQNDLSIHGIRLAFHKKDWRNMIEWGKVILDKGYELFIQPMLVMRYCDKELIELIEAVNSQLSKASAFYIVDSFGEMRTKDLIRVANLVDHNLKSNIALGFHSHNNLQLSYSNAVTLLEFLTSRNLIIDVSILGMGKGAGNLNAEIFAEHLNLYYEKNYNITAMLYVIDNVLNQIKEEYNWGYSIEYYLSASYHCTPSYAAFFYKKHTLSIDEIASLLDMIKEDKKISFDQEYAQDLYYSYNSKHYNDVESVKYLSKKLNNRNIILIAPGKSILGKKEFIKSYKKRKSAITITLNHVIEDVADYVFVTKKTAFKRIIAADKDIILTSNVEYSQSNHVYVINYDKYNLFNGDRTDISVIMLLNLLKGMNPKKIYMAGFDGFKSDIDENYYENNLRRPVSKKLAEERNALIARFIADAKKQLDLVFITPSMYEELIND